MYPAQTLQWIALAWNSRSLIIFYCCRINSGWDMATGIFEGRDHALPVCGAMHMVFNLGEIQEDGRDKPNPTLMDSCMSNENDADL